MWLRFGAESVCKVTAFFRTAKKFIVVLTTFCFSQPLRAVLFKSECKGRGFQPICQMSQEDFCVKKCFATESQRRNKVFGDVADVADDGCGGCDMGEGNFFINFVGDMARIDHETVQRILDATDIVEVVSDFVTLKRRGANYIGLCPFHNERTPSFSVSKSKGICKCFSCGKGGSAVNFIMELEQMSYVEALRYLAKKYNIEIKERELTDEEQRQESQREAMLAVNDFALGRFEHYMNETAAGRDIGKAYFEERGISAAMMKKFRLGYALEERDRLLNDAKKAGYQEQYLVDTGLCSRNEQGRTYDRFRGRVIYPVFSISGKVVAFGGRTLRNDKTMAKYVNSPESIIYSKRRELYGLYQAKQAINKRDKCILVEGYMDVISMFQRGVENVVASSGTSLTEEQIHVIHRFTQNVTVIYDSDAAGIKASLRGIDMLLANGLNVKTVLLPDGDDPDSFAQSHTSSEVEDYISAHETDFIEFKTKILLEGLENSPIERSRAINDIVKTIAVVPDAITRTVYIQETSRRLNIDEGVLTVQVDRYRGQAAEKQGYEQQRKDEHSRLDRNPETALPEAPRRSSDTSKTTKNTTDAARLRPFERELLRYAVKYGRVNACNAYDADNNATPMSVIEFIDYDLKADGIKLENSDIAATFAEAQAIASGNWTSDLASRTADIDREIAELRVSRHNELAAEATGSLEKLQRLDRELDEELAAERQRRIDEFSENYVSQALINHPDDTVRKLATELVSDKYVLSKVHTKYAKIETERDRLDEFVQRALWELKEAIVEQQIGQVRGEIAKLSASASATEEDTIARLNELLSKISELNRLKADFAKVTGERVITAR